VFAVSDFFSPSGSKVSMTGAYHVKRAV